MWLWFWLIGIVVVAALIGLLVDRRRGSSGASRTEDLPPTGERPNPIDMPHGGASM